MSEVENFTIEITTKLTIKNKVNAPSYVGMTGGEALHMENARTKEEILEWVMTNLPYLNEEDVQVENDVTLVVKL